MSVLAFTATSLGSFNLCQQSDRKQATSVGPVLAQLVRGETVGLCENYVYTYILSVYIHIYAIPLRVYIAVCAKTGTPKGGVWFEFWEHA